MGVLRSPFSLMLVVIAYFPQALFCGTAPRHVGLQMAQVRKFKQFIFPRHGSRLERLQHVGKRAQHNANVFVNLRATARIDVAQKATTYFPGNGSKIQIAWVGQVGA